MPVIDMPFWDVSWLACEGSGAGFSLVDTVIDYDGAHHGLAATSWIFLLSLDGTYWRGTGRIRLADGEILALPGLRQVERKERTIVVKTWEAV